MNEDRQTSSVEIVDYTFVCASRKGGATSKVVIPVPVYGDITEAALKGVIDRYIQLHPDFMKGRQPFPVEAYPPTPAASLRGCCFVDKNEWHKYVYEIELRHRLKTGSIRHVVVEFTKTPYILNQARLDYLESTYCLPEAVADGWKIVGVRLVGEQPLGDNTPLPMDELNEENATAAPQREIPIDDGDADGDAGVEFVWVHVGTDERGVNWIPCRREKNGEIVSFMGMMVQVDPADIRPLEDCPYPDYRVLRRQ